MTLSRYKAFGVGKRIGSIVYFHKSAFRAIPVKVREAWINHYMLLESLGYEYDVIKFDLKNVKNVTFIRSANFLTADEPTLDYCVTFKEGKQYAFRNLDNKTIYHHKWLFVLPTCELFDVQASEERSKLILECEYNPRSIGSRDYWEREVLPQLEGYTQE